MVIAHHDSVFIEQRGLKSAVRANKSTGLLSEARKDGKKYQSEDHHGCQSLCMIQGVVSDDVVKLVRSNSVGKQGVADNKGKA